MAIDDDVNGGRDRLRDDGGHEATRGSRPFLSGGFEEYRRAKLGRWFGSSGPSSDGGGEATASAARPQERGSSSWNHLTSPLTSDASRLPQQSQGDANRSSILPPSPSGAFTDLERGQTVDRFVKIFTERIGDSMSSGRLSSAWNGDGGGGGDGDYDAERRLMQPHFTPIVWGSGCMAVTLISLRLGRWQQAKQAAGMAARAGAGGSAHAAGASVRRVAGDARSLRNARHPHRNVQSSGNNSPFDPQATAKQSSLISDLATLPVDMALSMLVGISTSVFLSRPKILMDDVAKTPLLEGRSALAEELCIPFRTEMDDVNSGMCTYTLEGVRRQVPYSELWREENLGEFDSLRMVRDFVSNCAAREASAKAVLEAEGVMEPLSEKELLETRMRRPITPSISRGTEKDDVEMS